MSDPGAHDTSERSTFHSHNPAQADDSINPADAIDPNLAGSRPMADLYTWRAGELNAWQENDDYRQFGPGRMDVPESRPFCHSCYDGDYDDNGGHPTAEGHAFGFHAPADVHSMETGETNAYILRRV